MRFLYVTMSPWWLGEDEEIMKFSIESTFAYLTFISWYQNFVSKTGFQPKPMFKNVKFLIPKNKKLLNIAACILKQLTHWSSGGNAVSPGSAVVLCTYHEEFCMEIWAS